jgi:hypothetical protein
MIYLKVQLYEFVNVIFIMSWIGSNIHVDDLRIVLMCFL